MTMKSLFIIYDYQIFEMQRFGGISRYFCEIIKRISAKHKITVRYSINYYLTSWMLEKSLILLPRFIYKRYHSFFEKKNHEITKKLLKTGCRITLKIKYYNSIAKPTGNTKTLFKNKVNKSFYFVKHSLSLHYDSPNYIFFNVSLYYLPLLLLHTKNIRKI